MPIDGSLIAYIVMVVIGALLALAVYQKSFKKKGWVRNVVIIATIGLLAYGTMGILVNQEVITNATIGSAFFTATGVTTPTGGENIVVPEGTSTQLISTLKVSTIKEKYSNTYNTVDGTIRIYDQTTNPTDPTASAIDTITVSNGVGNSTNSRIKTNIPYRVVFDGASTYYDFDYGIVVFDSASFNEQTGEYGFDAGVIGQVAKIDDMLDETNVAGLVNGQSSVITGTDELGNSSDTLTYTISVGDGQFYIQPTLSISGANKEVKDAVLCFEHDITNPPEGNEMSALTYQLMSGTDFNFPTSDLLSYWSNEQCISLGTVASGTSSTIKLTMTVDESNLDANDDWYLRLDDLGMPRGKDVVLNSGATPDSIKFDHQA